MSHHATCAHCEAGDHDHLDSREHAHSRRRQLAAAIIARGVIVLAAVVALVVLPTRASLAELALAIGVGVALWVVSTGAGVVASTLLMGRVGRMGAMMSGALLTAALVPLLALVASRLGPWHWLYAAMVAAGFLIGAFAAEVVRLWRLRALLGQDTREGEVARDSAAITHAQDQDLADLLSTLAMAVLVGTYVGLTGLLWVLVLILVPLHVAIVAVRRRKALQRGRFAVRPAAAASSPSGT